MLGVLALIVLIAWREGFRFGPRVTRVAERRRQLMEHIDGIAQFFWQHRSSDKLLDALRDLEIDVQDGNRKVRIYVE